jgi:PAS domain S-box-containing protein
VQELQRLAIGRPELQVARTTVRIAHSLLRVGSPFSRYARRARWPAANLGLAFVYYVAARLGLSLGVVEQVTAVWPPTGIALGAVLLAGPRILPGVGLGALLANLGAGEPVGTALGIAAGNTLEALVGAGLLRRAGVARGLERVEDVLRLLLLAAPIASAVAALIGVVSLCAGGVQPWSSFARLFGVWWLGDAMGALLITPLILAWSDPPKLGERRTQGAELAVLFAGLAATAAVVFGRPHGAQPHVHSLAYAIFPFVAWSALRFGRHGTPLAIAAASAIATWGTAQGLGPFGAGAAEMRWLHLQGFMGLIAATGLMLAAAVAERDRSERHRAADAAIARILADGSELALAVPRILAAVGECLEFDCGAVWTVDRMAGRLRCVELWHRPGSALAEFVALTRRIAFAPGIGLPGRVWSRREPQWIEDVARDPNFPRAPAAALCGLHGAFGFPLSLGGEVLGVIEFFSREIRPPDAKLLQLLASAGSQIAQFIERKRAEEAVRSSEARKAGIVASALDAIVTMDGDGRVLEFNPSAERMFGLRARDALGRDLATLIVPERLRAAHRAGLARQLHTGERGLLDRRLEMPALRAGGTEFTVEVAITRVPDSEPPLFTGFMRDVTARKRAEAERAQLLANEQRARAQAEALAEQLRAEKKTKDEFLATLSHELRNPLAPISNAVQALLMREAGADPDRGLHELMARQLRHVTRLVDDLLDISRIDRGTTELRREPLDLVEVANAAIEMNRALLDARGHRLQLELPVGSVPIDADRTRIEQVVSNLLNNAARYTPAGGEIAVILERAGEAAVLRVRDTGIGIRTELLPRIFEPFLQGDRVPGSVHEGLGLGLALVRALVELHGGSVAAASAGAGRGSEFTVRLPLCPGAAPEPRGVPAAVQVPVPRRILIVDDNKDSAETLAIILSRQGHEVQIAHDGPDGLEKFHAFQPDVVLLDIALPRGMSGHDVARRIRQLPGTAGVRLIAMTGFGQLEDRERSREAGIEVHLVKPVDPRELQELIADPQAPRPSDPQAPRP